MQSEILLTELFPNLNQATIDQFNQLEIEFKIINEQVNLVSRRDIENLNLKHILHSLSIAKAIQFKPNTSVMDVGTGGGFPGLPLAILFPEVNFILVDSIGKKINAVKQLAEKLELKNIQAIHSRAEKLNYSVDFITARAVTRTKPILQWTRKQVKTEENNDLKNGWLLLKGGDLSEDLQGIRKCKIWNLNDWINHEFYETKKLIHIPLKNK